MAPTLTHHHQEAHFKGAAPSQGVNVQFSARTFFPIVLLLAITISLRDHGPLNCFLQSHLHTHCVTIINGLKFHHIIVVIIRWPHGHIIVFLVCVYHLDSFLTPLSCQGNLRAPNDPLRVKVCVSQCPTILPHMYILCCFSWRVGGGQDRAHIHTISHNKNKGTGGEMSVIIIIRGEMI